MRTPPVRRLLGLPLLSLAILTGCPEPDTIHDPNDPNLIQGSALDAYTTEEGRMNARVQDLASLSGDAALEALTLNEDGTWTSYPATIEESGRFEIAGVPEGEYYLRLPRLQPTSIPTFVVTSSRTLDLGYEYGGRIDGVAIDANHRALLDFSALQAFGTWTSGSEYLQVFSLNQNLQLNLTSTEITPNPDDWALPNLSLGVTLDLYDRLATATSAPTLIDSQKGDRLYVAKMSHVRIGTGWTYRTPTLIYAPEAVTMANGTTTTLGGSFQAVPPRTTTLNLPIKTWTGMEAEMSGTYRTTRVDFYADSSVAGQTINFANAPYVIESSLTIQADQKTQDSVPATFSYGNPFPSKWTERGTVSARFARTFQFPGVPAAYTVNETANVRLTLAQAEEAGKIAALIQHPPRNIRVNGIAANVNLQGIGTAPLISWDHPAQGAATYYRVSVVRPKLADDGQSVRFLEEVVAVLTDKTQVQLPGGYLKAGESYLIRVNATSGNYVADPLSAPFRNERDGVGYTQVYTEIVTP